MGDLACDLECIKKLPTQPKIHEFVGTVKILLIDTPASEYLYKRIDAGLITLAYFAMGATVMNVLFFTLAFKLPLYMNLHIVLCTCGYQLCIPCGILIFNTMSGSSNVLKISDRKIEHIVLQSFGLLLGICGTFSVYLSGNTKTTIHSFCGLLAGACGILAVVLGPIIFFLNKSWILYLQKAHVFLATICLLMSSFSMISGIHRHCIYFWLPVKHMASFLYSFCFFYTTIISIDVYNSMFIKPERT